MKGDKHLIELMNRNIKDEIEAMLQYQAHAAIVDNWNYNKLAKQFKTRSESEYDHAKQNQDKILFLEGLPIYMPTSPKVALDIQHMFLNDHDSELTAIADYNESIAYCIEIGDHSTRAMFEEIQKDETDHIMDIEDFIAEIEHQGLPIFLSTQFENKERSV